MTVRVWSGGAITNDRWSDKDNWEGKVAPQANDEIVFPAGIRDLDKGTNQNIDNAVFKSITFKDSGFKITGKTIRITGDLNTTSGSGLNEIATDVLFSAATHNLNITAGQLTLSGSLKGTGTGQIIKTGLGGVAARGSTSNTLALPLVINNGMFALSKSNGVAGYAGSSVTVASLAGNGHPSLFVSQDNAIPSTAAVTVSTFVSADTPATITITAGHTLRTGPLKLVAAKIEGPGNLILAGDVLTDGPNGTGLTSLISAGQVNLGAKTRRFTVTDNGQLNIQSPIVEPAGTSTLGQQLRKDGGGGLEFSRLPGVNAPNTYRGETRVEAGSLSVGTANPLTRLIQGDLIVGLPGSTNFAVFTSLIPQSIATTSHVTVQGAGQFNVADESLTSLDVKDHGIISESFGQLFNNQLPALRSQVANFSGSGGINPVVSQGRFAFLETVVTDTSLVVPESITFGRRLTLTGGTVRTTDPAVGEIVFQGSIRTLASNVSSKITGPVRFDVGPVAGVVEGDFDIADGAAANDLVVEGNFTQGTFIVPVGVAGKEFNKIGPGLMIVNSTVASASQNPLRSKFTLQEGTLFFSGTVFQSKVEDFGSKRVILGGNGSFDITSLSHNSVLAPGVDGPGIYKTRVLGLNGLNDVTQSARLQIQLKGLTPGTQFDQVITERAFLSTGGTITTAPVLDVQVGFTTALNQSFKIIEITDQKDNPTTNPSRLFRDPAGNVLTEGSVFTAGGVAFKISYVGGDGNDVVIRRVNTPPAFQNRSITPVIDEGGVATVTGLITEADAGDTFFLDVNWGDGSNETFTFAPGTPRQVAVSHRYLDDLHSHNPLAAYQVHLVWRDQNGGSNSADLKTIVRNVSPQVSGLKFDAPPVRGQAAVLRGIVFDPGPLDTIRLRVNWGDGSRVETIELPAGTTTFAVTHVFRRSGWNHVTVQGIDNNQAAGKKATLRSRVVR